MAHAAYLRDKARSMRVERHLAIDEIAERLALSRSTIYYWVRDLPLGRAARLNPHPGSRGQRRKYRLLREAAYEHGREMYPQLCEEPTFCDFVTLYIAEGYKRCRNTVALANSDPVVVKLADRWVRQFANSPVTHSIQYHADQDLDELVRYWGAELDVPPRSIRLQRKSNSSQLSKRTWRSEHGVLTVRTRDTYLRARLQAWIDSLRRDWLHSLGNGA